VIYRPPFPWFGGKSRVADLVWRRFGNVPNYVEPFFGSGAVMFLRPHDPKVETINDKDCFVANFWRALQADPDEVARWADWPVNEADLHARHWWLVNQVDFIARMHADPDYYDCKIAGWWVWGICQWIGSGWCSIDEKPSNKLPHLGDPGRGVHRPSQQLPHLGDPGMGVHRPSQQLPHLGNPGMGVHRPSQQLPHLGNPGRADLHEYMDALSERLRNVRVCCGDWERVLGPSPTEKLGITAVFLDPPYGHEDRDDNLYSVDSMTVASDVARWALENGDNPMLRIALCGYDGEFAPPGEWETVEWKASGGFSSQSAEYNDNPHKERIWFSPHCINTIKQPPLFVIDTPRTQQLTLEEAE
jgi:hypothetical protein